MAFFRLIRWQNLCIILLTQLLAWWCVLLPESRIHNTGLLDAQGIFCLSFSTILIAAAGYIINDYFDIKIDNINHPGKVILGGAIARKTAIILHAILNVAALLLAGRIAIKGHHPQWLMLQLTCIILLWFYSTRFKRQFITGNVVVALLTALTMLTLIVYEPLMHQALHIRLFDPGAAGGPSAFPVWVLSVYSYFAFMLTWMREIVKDMEDLEGDEAEGCVTMPIKIGLSRAATFTIILGVLAVVPLLLGAVSLYTRHYMLLAVYTVVFLSLPLVAWMVFLQRGTGVVHYGKASRGLKIIMVLGICSLLVYHFQLQ